MLQVAQSSRGAWHLAGTGSLHAALSNGTLRRSGFLLPSDLAGSSGACFNRRMRKTARPVVWEGDGAQSPSLDPIMAIKCKKLQAQADSCGTSSAEFRD